MGARDTRILWIVGITIVAALFYLGTPFIISTALYWTSQPSDLAERPELLHISHAEIDSRPRMVLARVRRQKPLVHRLMSKVPSHV